MQPRRRSALLATLLLLAAHPAARAQQPSTQAPPRRELIAHLNALAEAQLEHRAREVARIGTRAEAERRRAGVRETLLELIGGLPAERAPLRARGYGTIAGEGFRIEKLTYESLPGLVVTANLYLPTAGAGPYPAVLLTPGHTPEGKTSQYSLAANLARAGIAALAYDPISEGERIQHYDAERRASRVGRVTGEHGHAGVQTMLVGDHVSRYFLLDAMRGIDYLATRREIDADRIGAFGCSGGGTVTSYLAALDDRVKAVGSACYITTFQALLSTGDPQEAEQSIPAFIERGLDLPDWVEAAAPRPYAIVSTTGDFFPFAGAQRAYEEARRIYSLYGAEDRIQWITGPGGHGALGPVSGQIVSFFTRWLRGDPSPATYTPLRPTRPEELLVTRTGQLANSLGSETVHSVNRKRARDLAARARPLRTAAEVRSLQERLKERIRAVARVRAAPGGEPPAARVTGSTARQGYRLDELVFPMEEGIQLPAHLAVPQGAGPRRALLVMDPRPREEVTAPGGEVDRMARAGWVVLVLQPRGTPGGTEEIKSPLLGDYYLLSLRAMLVGRTIVGMRTDDAVRAVDWLASRPEVDRARIAVHAVGPLAPVALHAAALDERIGSLYLERGLAAYRMAVDNPIHRNLPEVALPGVLRSYDLPDLLLALGPRPVALIDPVDQLGEPLDERGLRRTIMHVLDTDRALGRRERVRFVTRRAGDPIPVE